MGVMLHVRGSVIGRVSKGCTGCAGSREGVEGSKCYIILCAADRRD